MDINQESTDSSMLEIGPIHFSSNRKFDTILCLSGNLETVHYDSSMNLHCLQKPLIAHGSKSAK